jgi:hypothetical protein
VNLYIHSPIRLHAVVLNWLKTGKTLPLNRFIICEFRPLVYSVAAGENMRVWSVL